MRYIDHLRMVAYVLLGVSVKAKTLDPQHLYVVKGRTVSVDGRPADFQHGIHGYVPLDGGDRKGDLPLCVSLVGYDVGGAKDRDFAGEAIIGYPLIVGREPGAGMRVPRDRETLEERLELELSHEFGIHEAVLDLFLVVDRT